MIIPKGSTNISATIRVVDDTDGTAENGVTSATAGLVLNYRRELAVSTSLSTLTDLAALTTAHTDKGMILIGDGYYRVDIPDAAFAAGANEVMIHGTVTGMEVIGQHIQLIDIDIFDGVNGGLSKLSSMTFTVANQLDTNSLSVSGTTQTASDNGQGINTLLGKIVGSILAGDHSPQSGDVFGQLPTKFSSLAIDGSGRVNAFLLGFIATLLTESTAGRITGNFDTFFDNSDAATTKTVDDVGGGSGGTSDWTTSEKNEIRGRLGVTGTTATGGNTPTLATAAIQDTINLKVADVLLDTDELQTDWANGGRLDLIVDAILSDTGTDGVSISAAVANQIADAILNRDMSAVSDTNARSMLNALRFLRNKWGVAGTTLTVNKEDDTTPAWTATVSTDAAADPVTGSDPA